MADFKIVAAVYPNAASNTSLTSAFQVPGEFSQFAIEVPASALVTATGNIRVLGAGSQGGTFREVGYSNNPATATSGFRLWETPMSAAVSGGFVICEALAFVPWAKLQFTNTATANVAFNVYGRVF